MPDGTYAMCVCGPMVDLGMGDGSLDDASGDGGSDGGLDAGTDLGADAATTCASDTDCDDSLYCNGAETCMPSGAMANPMGCVPGTNPCLGMACSEATHACASCATAGDMDGDGHRSVSCGGGDCNDSDPSVYPGAMEVCDGVDNDCDGVVDDEPFASAGCASGHHCASGACTTGATTRKVALGAYSSCALFTDGNVQCWGSNMFGNLGDGTATDSLTPVDTGVTDAIDIGCDTETCCALHASGVPACWGQNGGLVLESTDTTLQRRSPTDLTGLTNGARLYLGSCAAIIERSGALDQWGRAPVVVVGATPATIPIGGPIVDLGGDNLVNCGVHASGTVTCIGVDDAIWDGPAPPAGGPGDIAGISSATQITGTDDAACVVLADGTVSCWGNDIYGALGRAATTSPQPPTAVPGLDHVVAITSGELHVCALRDTGDVWCWGTNTNGQIGNGMTTPAPTPTLVGGLPPADWVFAGGIAHGTCAHTTDGVYCWGDDTYGQLGDGVTGTNQLFPVRIAALP